MGHPVLSIGEAPILCLSFSELNLQGFNLHHCSLVRKLKVMTLVTSVEKQLPLDISNQDMKHFASVVKLSLIA